ncbi:MAG: DUF2339 domain-containing protein, partial [Planctomycetaceae bacterium]
TGQDDFVGLYGYMSILGAGVLYVSRRKQWPLLSYLAFACNFGLVAVSLRDYRMLEHFWQVMPFLTVFFILFSTMVFVYNLRRRAKSNLLDVLMLFLNAGIFFALSYRFIEEMYGREWVAAATLGLAAFYAAHVYYCLARRVLDRELMVSFLGLSAFFVTVSIPLVLSNEWITVSWSLQALVMLWIALRLNSEFLRQVSYLLYAIVLFRFGALDLGGQFAHGDPVGLSTAEYLRNLVQRLTMFGVPIASMGAAWQLLKRAHASSRWAVDSSTDVPGWIRQNWAMQGVVVLAAGMLFLYLHLELNRSFGFFLPIFRLPGLTLLWVAMCSILLVLYRESKQPAMFALMVMFLAGAMLKLFMFDVPSWSMSANFQYGGGYSFLDASMRFLDFGVVIAFLVWAALLLGGSLREYDAGKVIGGPAIALSFVYTSLEVNTALAEFLPGMRAGGVSILWSMYALGMLLFGIWRRSNALRYCGLSLFTVIALKVFFSDLATLDQIYRIVAFILLGVLVLAASFLYMKYRDTFLTEPDATKGSET